MTLLSAGYWPTTYWSENYWEVHYWPAYGGAVAPSTPTIRKFVVRLYDRTFIIDREDT